MKEIYDAIIIGGGLAGLTVALELITNDDGLQEKILVLEKEPKVGGNSMKASSGINAVLVTDDSDESEFSLFEQDTIRSAGEAAQPRLIKTLVRESKDALEFLKSIVGAELTEVSQLGGHSAPRTHRPNGNLPVGVEIMVNLQKKLAAAPQKVEIRVNSKVTQIRREDMHDSSDSTTRCQYAVEYNNVEKQEITTVHSENVVLATGGFAAGRELLAKYRPELCNFPVTAGEFSTGDGIQLAESLEASLTDIDKIQIHPTGFVDEKDPENLNKFLAAEVLRGVGGILLAPNGKRFCNELGQRNYVTQKILELHSEYAVNKEWRADFDSPKLYLLLSKEAAESCQKHVDFYIWKGLMKKLSGMKALAEYIGVSIEVLRKTLEDYQAVAQSGNCDEFGKERFPNVPDINLQMENEYDFVYYVGKVTPVSHYCMGGVSIDENGNILAKSDQTPIPGLYACGEVAGGVHGDNRLAGNSLLECVVYGRIVARNILFK